MSDGVSGVEICLALREWWAEEGSLPPGLGVKGDLSWQVCGEGFLELNDRARQSCVTLGSQRTPHMGK